MVYNCSNHTYCYFESRIPIPYREKNHNKHFIMKKEMNQGKMKSCMEASEKT